MPRRSETREQSHDDSAVTKIRSYHDDLEALADSDLPVSWVAEELLDIADEAARE